MQLSVWSSRIESNFPIEEEGKDILSIEGTLILQGLYLAYQISNSLKTALFLHAQLDKPFKVAQVVDLMRHVEMLKAIQDTFHRRSATFASHISMLLEFIAYKIQRLLLPLKNRLESKKKPTDAEVDQLSAVTLALELLSSPPTRKRILLLRLTLAVALQKVFIYEIYLL